MSACGKLRAQGQGRPTVAIEGVIQHNPFPVRTVPPGVRSGQMRTLLRATDGTEARVRANTMISVELVQQRSRHWFLKEKTLEVPPRRDTSALLAYQRPICIPTQ